MGYRVQYQLSLADNMRKQRTVVGSFWHSPWAHYQRVRQRILKRLTFARRPFISVGVASGKDVIAEFI